MIKNLTIILTIFVSLLCMQKDHHQESRFWVLLMELREADTGPYRIVMMALINCLINCTPDIKDRVRIRNEFVGEHCILRGKNILNLQFNYSHMEKSVLVLDVYFNIVKDCKHPF